jgi:uncharacterized protein YkwD
VCTGGTDTCTPGSPTGSDDDCDGVDQDCDGMVDEHYAPLWVCGVGVCTRYPACVGGIESCTPGSPTGDDTDCDAVDDDCDGMVDEHYVPYFCGTGGCMWPSTCVSGFESCTPRSPSPDTNCDGIDDDCDGAVDDDYIPYTCGWGTCMATSVCVGGVESCTPPYDSSLWPGIWTVYEMDVVTEMNAERLAGASCRGTWYPPVAALTMSAELHDAARCHSLDMSSHDYLGHTGSDGSGFSARCTSAGYAGTARGENVAAGPTTAAAVVASWMASTSGECEMIMDPGASEVGVGYSYDSSSTWGRYWTADFGHP